MPAATTEGRGYYEAMMSNHYASHAGLLVYLSQQFRDAAQAEADPRFVAYADMLDRIVGDLMGRDTNQPEAAAGHGAG